MVAAGVEVSYVDISATTDAASPNIKKANADDTNSFKTYDKCYTDALSKYWEKLAKKEEADSKTGDAKNKEEGSKNLKSAKSFFKSGGYKLLK